ncbi:choice-of-anchor J domain-containing protein, partial [Flavobacterium urocaniciphilum]
MRKLLLLLLMLVGFNVFGQTEDFEGLTFPPTGWTIFETGTGVSQSWTETANPLFTYGGVGKSAFLNRENVPDGTFAVDWLVTKQLTVPANGQIRFFTKTLQAGNQLSLFDVKISTTSQTNPASFTTIQSWDESSLTTVANVYEEKVIDLNTATYPAGTLVYIAFVMTNDNGDRWLIDNFNLLQKCSTPTAPLNTTNESTDSAQLSWGNPDGATEWEVQVCPFSDTFGGPTTITYTNVLTNPFIATGLQPNTLYKFQVRKVCTGTLGEYTSDWFGPRSFQTTSFGDTCAGPIIVGTLPYSSTENTANFLDTNDLQPPLACTGSATNYMAGNDVFYSFTPSFTGNIAVSLTPTAANSSIHIYSACPGTAGATCLWGAGNNT